MSWNAYIVYVGLVGALGGGLMWWLHCRIAIAWASRSARIEQIKRFDAIRTASPVDDQDRWARQHGLESVETRFNMMRRVLLPALAAVLFAVIVLPLLSGAPSALLSFVLGVAAVLTGIAARPFLENLMGGVIISFAQPIRIGDTVLMDGHFGVIESISLTHTILKTWDWRRYIVPNQHMVSKELVNYSIIDRYQWAYVEFWVAPATNLDEVRDVGIEAARASAHYADYEEPRFWVMEMGKEGLRCWIAAWADTPSAAWQLGHDIRTHLARRFCQLGISTHIYQHHWNPDPRVPIPGVGHNPPAGAP